VRKRLFLGLALTGLVLLAAAPTADSAPQTSSGFTIVASPRLRHTSYLTAVAAVSASDVWAIGSYWGGSRLMEHYNGSSWRVVTPPPLPHARLDSISAHGSALWVVGSCRVAEGWFGCVARYTGSRWVRVAVPRQFSYNIGFHAVLAFSNTNVVVGEGEGPTQMIRWNGRGWSRVNDVPPHHTILGLAGTLSSHLFAVSYNVVEREQPDGSWLSDNLSNPDAYASGISASSAENAWVLSRWIDSAGNWHPLAMRWNGTTATPVGVPSSPASSYLTGVVTTRPNNTWAVGARATATDGSETLIEHYTGGSSFTELGAPDTAGQYNELAAIAAVPGSESDLWAVGQGNNQPLILHHS